jgi:hypothetical protein
MVGSPAAYSLAQVRSDGAWVRRYSAAVAAVAGCFLIGAALGAGFVGFGGG